MEKYFLKNSAGVVGQKLSKHGFWNTDQRTSYFWVSKKLLCLLPSDNFEGMLFFSPLFIFWLQLQQLVKCYQFFRSVEKTWYFFHFLKLARLICAIWMKAGYKSQGNYCLLLCCILILWEGASHIELTSAVGKLHFKHFKSIFFCCTAIGLAWQVVKEGRQVFWKLMLE